MIHAFRIDILRQDLVHPRARAFACTREIIGIEDAHETAIGFGYFEDLHLFVIHRHILQFLELHTVQLSGYTKRTFAYVIQLKIGFDLFLIQRILGFTQFLGVEPPVPRLQFLSRVVLF